MCKFVKGFLSFDLDRNDNSLKRCFCAVFVSKFGLDFVDLYHFFRASVKRDLRAFLLHFEKKSINLIK